MEKNFESGNPRKIAIIGRGNVATHLSEAFKGKADVCLVNPHTLEGIQEEPDLILLCVSDDAIEALSRKLHDIDSVVAHTSGSVSLSALKDTGKHYGVFYPLQTFTKNIPLNYSEIPVFIEASSPEVKNLLYEIASLFTNSIHSAGSEERRKLHLASVFACNFTNAMANIGFNILSETGIDPKVLLPLMRQTVDKLKWQNPGQAQTGPAARGDIGTIGKHLDMLKDSPELREIYSEITRFISSSLKI
ncbi:MAG: DUF2520 domain-containing protein [Muribaculaceae bacterium]|nr:DUF2520 domain-containing protein [Muribaculaceae bacterium]